jgi:hypothetical protein
LEQPSANCDIEAVLERYVVMVDGLDTGKESIGLLSLCSEGFDILRLNFGQQLPAKGWSQVPLGHGEWQS